jgi:hypothetical protein
MQFAIFDSPPLIRLRSPVASIFQFLLRGLSIRMTRFGAIGQIARTVLFLQMRFAVFDSLLLIRWRDWIAFTFQFRLWVVASDDCCRCYCPESPSQLQFADFDLLAPIRPPSQLAFILLSRLFGLSLSDDCCGCNWHNGLWLSSPQMRFAVFHSRNSFR